MGQRRNGGKTVSRFDRRRRTCGGHGWLGKGIEGSCSERGLSSTPAARVKEASGRAFRPVAIAQGCPPFPLVSKQNGAGHPSGAAPPRAPLHAIRRGRATLNGLRAKNCPANLQR